MAEAIRVIKKYQNRKLYDTQDSCYVTLDGIAKMVRDGEEILVVDNNTKEDVTALIYTQVLYEQEKTKQSVLPVSILKNIIKSGSNNFYEFMQKYILGAFEAQSLLEIELNNHIEKMVQKGSLNAQEALSLEQQIKTLKESHKTELDQKISEKLDGYLKTASSQNLANRTSTLESRAS